MAEDCYSPVSQVSQDRDISPRTPAERAERSEAGLARHFLLNQPSNAFNWLIINVKCVYGVNHTAIYSSA